MNTGEGKALSRFPVEGGEGDLERPGGLEEWIDLSSS